MATFAVIENDKVVNTIVADSKEIAELVTGQTCVEYTDENRAGIGWTYDGEKFIEPMPVITVEEISTDITTNK
jgi:hypothetical protein